VAAISQYYHNALEEARNPTASNLLLAGRATITNITFPSFGSGPRGYPLGACALGAYNAVNTWLAAPYENPAEQAARRAQFTDNTFVVPYSYSPKLEPRSIENAWRGEWA
jgi:O-acetyl-ADP-ribose deacetylase (regulator of RNase III)